MKPHIKTWVVLKILYLVLVIFGALFCAPLHRASAALPHTWTGDPANPYGLTDLDHFSDAYNYCKWGTLMSEDGNYLPYTHLTDFFDKSGFFLNIGKSNLGPISPATAYYQDDPSNWRLIYSNPNATAGSTVPVAYSLFRKLHFSDMLSDAVSGQVIDGQAKKVIVLIHGWNSTSNSDPFSGAEFAALKSALKSQLTNTEWKLVYYDWKEDADTGGRDIDAAIHGARAAEIAHRQGQHLGELLDTLTQHNLQKVHFIAHSAGSWAARSAAKYLLSQTTSPPKTAITLLDPYIPGALGALTGTTLLNNAHMSEINLWSFATADNLYLLDNYYAVDNYLGSDFALGTQEVFSWRLGIDINQRVDWPTNVDNSLRYYRDHFGPIQFYADTAAFPNVADATPLTPFNLGKLGWRASMFYQEPQVAALPSLTKTYSPGDSVPPLSTTVKIRGQFGVALSTGTFSWQKKTPTGVWINDVTGTVNPTNTTYTIPAYPISVIAGMDGTLYRLVFANSAGTDVSNEVALHVGSNGSFAPARPTDLTATAVSSSQINLSWNDNSSNESDFIIQRKAGSTGTYATVGTAPSSNNTKGAYFDNLGLVQGTPYYYQVIAAGSPNSDPSNEASAATQINTGSTRALTVNSANPGSGVHIYVSPNDTNGMADGDTSFFRQYTSTVTATVYASATWNGNSFQKWQRDGQDWTTNTVANVIMDTSHTMTAVYATPVQTVGNYTVAVSASPLVGGTVTGNGSYAANASAMIQATAAPGYTFLHWTQNTSGGATFAVQPQVTFQVTSNLSLVANFTQDANSNYTVTTTAEPANGGTATGAGSYAPSSNVNLSAQPASGYVFDYWTENGVVISYSQSYQYPQVSKSHDFVAHFHVRGSGTPDVVPSMALDRQFYFPGETINITGDVKNKGSVASNACQLYWIVSDSAVSPPDPATLGSVYPGINFWMPYYPSIPAGVAGGAGVGLQLKDYNGVALAPGNYYVWMLFDPGNTDGETAANRVNNNLVVPFTVLPPPANNGPDVIPHDFTVTPAIAFPSGTLDVKGGIRNAGNVASAGFKYYVSISTSATVAPDKNALNVSGTVPALGVYVDAGADSSFALPSTLAPGNYYLWVMVNPENDAGEPQANQSNNNVVLPLTVIAKPRTFTITATASSNGSANGDGTYVSGALVPLIATPAIGYRIVNWTEGATVVSTSANYTFIANADRSLVATFAVNTPPNAPNNITPVAGAANQSVTSTLIASAFVDPDSGDTQTAAQWIVRRVSDNQVVFDSGEDAFHKTSISVTPALDYVTAYQWQVRYKDTSGAWSTYSTPTNFTTQQKPVSSFVPYQGSYSGVIQSGTSSHALSGLITIGVTSTGAFTASVNFGGQISSLRGVFRSDGTFSGLILRKGLSPLTLSLTLDTTNGTNSITGTFSDGVTTATLTADRAAYSKMIPAPAEKVGSYTVLLPPDPAHPEATAPQGAGYGTLTVDSAGAIRFAGVLGDGTKASQGASLTADGTWPFYVAPYKLGGSVSGWIAFLAVANVSDFNGTLNWFKLANPTDALYRAGFSTQISLIGSRYTVPPIGTRVLFANTGGAATFTITGGNLNPSAPQEKLFFSTLNTVSLVSGPPFTMKLTLTTGVFAGTFADPGGSKPRAFSGVLFQKQNLGAGLFIGNTQTGSVNLTPQ